MNIEQTSAAPSIGFDEFCGQLEGWRRRGFAHLVLREGSGGHDSYLFPANAEALDPQERIDCILALPLNEFCAGELLATLRVLSAASQCTWVIGGHSFLRLAPPPPV